MRKTFTCLLLLFALTFSLPTITQAYAFESSYSDTRLGDKELIKVYPNPMVSYASIKISSDIDMERSKVSIVFYNIIGSEVYKIAQVKDYDLKINKDVFKNSGIYFYQLKVDESVMSTGRITVK